MSFGVLVGPSDDQTTLLDESEYSMIEHVLKLHRSEDKEASAILYALPGSTKEETALAGTLRAFFLHLLSALGDHSDEIQGMLVEQGKHPIFIREGQGAEHAVALKAFLKILQSGNWLANFFAPVRIEKYAEETPTPLKVMQDLAEPAMIFESDVADAKKMMREWPEIVCNFASPASAPRGKRAKSQANAAASQSSHAFSSKAGASL